MVTLVPFLIAISIHVTREGDDPGFSWALGFPSIISIHVTREGDD